MHLQAPPPEPTDRGAQQQQKKKKKKKDGVTEAGRSSIRTSSLFKHNPDIPEILRYAAPPLIGCTEPPLIGSYYS